jgi:hypothetical protein
LNENGSIHLFSFLQNNPLNQVDHLGRISVRELWSLAKEFLNGTALKMFKNLERDRRILPAVGVQAGVEYVPGIGKVVFGINGMFFPEECEIGGYWFINGIYKPQKWASDYSSEDLKKELLSTGRILARSVSAGWLFGGGVEGVKAVPIGGGKHLADSWTQWFYTAMGSLPGGVSGSAYFSSSWAGVSLGYGLGAPGGAYAALYYDWLGGTGSKWYIKIDNYCLCNALRFASVKRPEKLRRIIAAVIDN